MYPTKWLFILLVIFSFPVLGADAFKVQNNALVLPKDIQFDSHGYDVKDTLDPMLRFVANYLITRPSRF